MPVDPESGQVYGEIIVKIDSKPRANIDHHLRPGVHAKGARKLSKLALRCVLRYIDDITVSTLSSLDQLTLERLWGSVRRAKLDDVYVWRKFASTDKLGSTFDGEYNVYRRDHRSSSPVTSMVELVRVCSCPKLEWLTDLQICAGTMALSDLMLIPRIHNLQSLSLAVEEERWETSLTRVINSWASDHERGVAFQHLRAMFFDDSRKRTDVCALKTFRPFSKLQVLSILTYDASSWPGLLWPGSTTESTSMTASSKSFPSEQYLDTDFWDYAERNYIDGCKKAQSSSEGGRSVLRAHYENESSKEQGQHVSKPVEFLSFARDTLLVKRPRESIKPPRTHNALKRPKIRDSRVRDLDQAFAFLDPQ